MHIIPKWRFELPLIQFSIHNSTQSSLHFKLHKNANHIKVKRPDVI